ncbi:hypothetical protein LTR36_010562 [Oleoguttula mirabilis]|uniref:N-acetyltransferase domain-containing protein n=1 Tax=Oleoguttula mirabilis TaxID=1507867 RepID=A0AAV9JQQ9_9PEZI|nr:hypothetical protein LTR36_010562 [Oleoguttula mirabilis]
MFYTDRLMLRNFDEQADLNTMLQWLNDVDFLQALSSDARRPASRETAKAFVQTRMKNEGGQPCFVVCARPEDHLRPEKLAVGDDMFVADGKARYPMVGLLNIRNPNFSATNRREYGAELLRWACDYMFNDLGLHRCELEVAADNVRAMKCYEKVGFVVEGRQREAYLARGVWKDHVLMAMLEREWREKQKQVPGS